MLQSGESSVCVKGALGLCPTNWPICRCEVVKLCEPQSAMHRQFQGMAMARSRQTRSRHSGETWVMGDGVGVQLSSTCTLICQLTFYIDSLHHMRLRSCLSLWSVVVSHHVETCRGRTGSVRVERRLPSTRSYFFVCCMFFFVWRYSRGFRPPLHPTILPGPLCISLYIYIYIVTFL